MRKKPLFIFYLLVSYVFLQFSWWSYLIYSLNRDITDLKQEIVTLNGKYESENIIVQRKQELEDKLAKRRYMLAGEGTVFLALLIIGTLQTLKSVNKETALIKRQNNFMLSITHELKTPLASTRLQLETLLKRDLPKDKKDQILQNAINDNDRLTSLIENILLASRMENGNFAVYPERLNLKDFCVDLLQQSNVFRNHLPSILLTIPNNIEVQADPFVLNSILVNLIDNGLKYSDNGPVNVIARKSGTSVTLVVSDTGKGIPPKEQKQIFEKFYRIGNEETRNKKGTGLGLFIVNGLAKAHNWQISVSNNTPKGCKFELLITS